MNDKIRNRLLKLKTMSESKSNHNEAAVARELYDKLCKIHGLDSGVLEDLELKMYNIMVPSDYMKELLRRIIDSYDILDVGKMRRHSHNNVYFKCDKDTYEFISHEFWFHQAKADEILQGVMRSYADTNYPWKRRCDECRYQLSDGICANARSDKHLENTEGLVDVESSDECYNPKEIYCSTSKRSNEYKLGASLEVGRYRVTKAITSKEED